MPYTTEQLHRVSYNYRHAIRSEFDYLARFARANALDALRGYESDYQWSVQLLNAVSKIECHDCGEVIGYVDADGNRVLRYPAEVVDVDGYQLFCNADCAHSYGWYECEECGDWVYDYNSIFIDGFGTFCDEWCARHYGLTRCGRCDEWVHEDDAHSVGDEEWCEHCFDYYASRCDECGEYYPEQSVRYDEEADMCVCENCAPRNRSAVLHEYGWTPSLSFFDEGGVWTPAPKAPMFLGVELETDGGSNRGGYVDALARIEGFCERFWMTRDSSLDNGVEITGHPMTLGAHVALRELYEAIGEAAKGYGFKSHDGGRCGLHVHVNRNFFGKDYRLQDAGGYKLLRLFQRFEQQFVIFSRRLDTGWCSYSTRRDYKLKDEVRILRAGKDESGLLQKAHEMERFEKAHGQCVNFEHPSTFEIRIFRGTLKWSTYFASLGLVNGLCNTVRNRGSIWVESVNWLGLMDEVIKRCDEPFAKECLANYLDERGLR